MNRMDYDNWEIIAPTPSDEFHSLFEETLQEITKEKIHPRHYKVMIVAAALCILMSGTVLAAEWFKWDSHILNYFKPTLENQEKFADEGVIQNIDTTFCKEDISITLNQVLHDEHSLYLLCEVEFLKSMTLEEKDDLYANCSVTLDGKDILNGYDTTGGGSSKFIFTTDKQKTALLEIRYGLTTPIEWSGKSLVMTIQNLQTHSGTYATGPWIFDFALEELDDVSQTIEINQTYDFGGYDIQINRLRISPLSYTIYSDYEDAMKVAEDPKNTFYYNGNDGGLEIDARLRIHKIKFKDGTYISADEEQLTGGGTYEPNVPEFTEFICYENFEKLIDVDQIESIFLMQGEVEIPIDLSN